jgi:hypothetical protein
VLGDQPVDRIADRREADAEFGRHLAQEDPLTRPEPPAEHCCAQLGVGLIPERQSLDLSHRVGPRPSANPRRGSRWINANGCDRA